MWERRTFHDCAKELEQVSFRFRMAHVGDGPNNERDRQRELKETSIAGVEILRILALAIRSEQDYGSTPDIPAFVGAIKQDIEIEDCKVFLRTYEAPYATLDGFDPLRLRDALNKIAHADSSRSGYFANREDHDLLLCGTQGRKNWLAVISIPALCKEIESLPDAIVR